jgi:hypothetical protein
VVGRGVAAYGTRGVVRVRPGGNTEISPRPSGIREEEDITK